MPKVILSTNHTINYIFFAPITCFMWNYFGFKSILTILGDSKYKEIVYKYINKYTDTEIFELEDIKPYREDTQVQISRLYGACLDNNDNEYIITGDIDMIPLNRYLYRDFDKRNLFGFDLTWWSTYPMCYVGMTVKDWRDFLDLEYGKIKDNMTRDLLTEPLALSQEFNDYWSTDQRFLTKKVIEYGVDKFQSIERGRHAEGFADKRVDRWKWHFTPGEDYIDCHMYNPLEKERFNKNYEVISNTIKDKDTSWILEYYEKIKEII